MTIETPLYLQTGTYSARQDRFLIGYLFTEGVADVIGGDLLVTQHAAGANMSVDIAPGSAVVEGDDTADQGSYLVRVTATENLVVPAAPSANSRIDLVILKVSDSVATGGDASDDGAAFEIVSGDAASSPVAPDVPDTALVVAQIVVASGTTSISSDDITDMRASTVGATNGVSQTFTSSGVYTVPASVKYVDVLVIAAGQGGQGGYSNNGGSGGPGGCAVFARGVPVSPGDEIAVTVGAGSSGSPGNATSTSAATPGSGGQSSFGALITAYGPATQSNGTSTGYDTTAFSTSPGGLQVLKGIVTGTKNSPLSELGALFMGAGVQLLGSKSFTPSAGTAGAAATGTNAGSGGAAGSAGFCGTGGTGGTTASANGSVGTYGAGSGGGATDNVAGAVGGKGSNGAPNSGAGGGGGGKGYSTTSTGGDGGTGGSGLVIVLPR